GDRQRPACDLGFRVGVPDEPAEPDAGARGRNGLRDGEPGGQLRLVERREGDRFVRRKGGRARSGGGRETLRGDVSGWAAGDAGETRGMNETQRLEKLLAGDNGGSVTLPRRDAQELAQKLKVRGNPGAAARLVELLNSPGDVDLDPEEAKTLLDQLRESGRRWVFGTNEPRELPSMKAAEAEPEPERQPEAE